MPEILIFIHGNRFLINEIKIKLLMKYSTLVKLISVLPGICWCEWYMI